MDILGVLVLGLCLLLNVVDGYSVLGLPDPLPLGGAALRLQRMRRMAASSPTLSTENPCDPKTDKTNFQCKRIIFSWENLPGDTDVTCQFIPISYPSDGLPGEEKTHLKRSVGATVNEYGETPEVHCPVPDYGLLLRDAKFAVEYKISLTTNDVDFSDPVNVIILHTACQERGPASDVVLKSDFCLIDGECVGDGEARPGNPQQTCSTADAKDEWTGPEATEPPPTEPETSMAPDDPTTMGPEDPTTAEPLPQETTEQPAEQPTEQPTEPDAEVTTEGGAKPTVAPAEEMTAEVTNPEMEQTTQPQVEPTTAGKPEPPIKPVTEEPTEGDKDRATAPVNNERKDVDMVALLVSVIVLEILLIIVVVMVFMYIRSRRQKYTVN